MIKKKFNETNKNGSCLQYSIEQIFRKGNCSLKKTYSIRFASRINHSYDEKKSFLWCLISKKRECELCVKYQTKGVEREKKKIKELKRQMVHYSFRVHHRHRHWHDGMLHRHIDRQTVLKWIKLHQIAHAILRDVC